MRWQTSSTSFHPGREITEPVEGHWHPSVQTSNAFSSWYFLIWWLYFKKKKLNLHLIFLFFLNCDQTVPQFGKLPYKIVEGLKLSSSSKWIMKTEYFNMCSFAFLFATRKFMTATKNKVFIFRKLVLCYCTPLLSIKSNGCNSLLHSSAPFPAAHRGLEHAVWESSGRDGLEVLSSSQICVFNI